MNTTGWDLDPIALSIFLGALGAIIGELFMEGGSRNLTVTQNIVFAVSLTTFLIAGIWLRLSMGPLVKETKQE